jgi:hypothetical protein
MAKNLIIPFSDLVLKLSKVLFRKYISILFNVTGNGLKQKTSFESAPKPPQFRVKNTMNTTKIRNDLEIHPLRQLIPFKLFPENINKYIQS